MNMQENRGFWMNGVFFNAYCDLDHRFKFVVKSIFVNYF